MYDFHLQRNAEKVDRSEVSATAFRSIQIGNLELVVANIRRRGERLAVNN